MQPSSLSMPGPHYKLRTLHLPHRNPKRTRVNTHMIVEYVDVMISRMLLVHKFIVRKFIVHKFIVQIKQRI